MAQHPRQILYSALLASLCLHALLLAPGPASLARTASQSASGLHARLNTSTAIPAPAAKASAAANRRSTAVQKTPRLLLPTDSPRTVDAVPSTEDNALVDSDLGTYRLALALSLRRQAATFPSGPPGRAIFRLQLDAHGQLASLNLLAGSGQEERDRLAAERLRLAVGQTNPPSGLSQRGLSTELTIDFSTE